MYKWRSAWLQYVSEQRLLWLVPRSFDVLALLTPVFYREPPAALCGGFAALHWTLHPAPGKSHGRTSAHLSWGLQLAWFLIISYWIWAFNSWKCNGGSFLEPPCSYAHVSTYSDSDSMLTQNNFIAVKFDSVFRFNLYHLHQILKRKLCGVLPN